jgi:hypothetical protein
LANFAKYISAKNHNRQRNQGLHPEQGFEEKSLFDLISPFFIEKLSHRKRLQGKKTLLSAGHKGDFRNTFASPAGRATMPASVL